MRAEQLQSWGRYPAVHQIGHQIEWRDQLTHDYSLLIEKYGTLLPYGNGRSYGDSCLARSDHVLRMRSLSRFIAVDWAHGVVRAEAGVTLGEILALALPRGWFLSVTPGTRFVTLGGAIANDVHGKNHHVRGTFGRHVRSFRLLRSDRGGLVCAPEVEADLFRATIGGLGLTGVIEWAELQLIAVKSAFMEASTVRFDCLADFFSLSAQLDKTHEYTVAWIDSLAAGAGTGRGVFMAANHSEEGGLAAREARSLPIPLTPPISVVNRISARLFNSAYFWMHRGGRKRSRPGYEKFFYPLDRVRDWNRIYGPRGLQQFQCVVPERNAEAATRELLRCIATSSNASFLAVLKKCGGLASPGLLSFPMAGTSLALDFAHSDSLNEATFPRLDAIVRAAGGRLYPAKDAHMSAQDFRSFYPDWARVEALRDPALASRFWDRVTRT